MTVPDFNECDNDNNVCSSSEECINTIGAYFCIDNNIGECPQYCLPGLCNVALDFH